MVKTSDDPAVKSALKELGRTQSAYERLRTRESAQRERVATLGQKKDGRPSKALANARARLKQAELARREAEAALREARKLVREQKQLAAELARKERAKERAVAAFAKRWERDYDRALARKKKNIRLRKHDIR